ncbi:40S ribosomal protein S3-1-like protein [Tanacetum coccineum]
MTSLVQIRFKFPETSVELYAELCAIAHAESLRYKLFGGLVVRRHAMVFLDSSWRTELKGASGQGSQGLDFLLHFSEPIIGDCECKSVKFKDGYMVSSSQPVKEYIEAAVRHMLLRHDDVIAHPSEEVEEYRPPLVLAD